jgi:hypothetical protein
MNTILTHLKCMFQKPIYLKQLAFGTGAGMMFVGFCHIFSKNLESRQLAPQLLTYEYLHTNENVCDLLNDLLFRLQLNGSFSSRQEANFHKLCANFNILAGYDLLVDHDKPLMLQTNYLIQELIASNISCFTTILNQKFHIIKLGTEICDLVEKLENSAKDIAHNVNFHLQLFSNRLI